MGDRAELRPDRLELEAASLSVADLLDAANTGACGDRLFARFDDTLCLLDRARKEVVAYDLAAGAVIARVDLGADSWCILWAEEPRRLVCLDPEGALILIDPAQGWSKTVVAMQGPAMPDEAAVRGSRLLVAHHGRKRLDLYDLSGGGAALLRSYPVTAASVAFSGDGLVELVGLIASDETLRDACCQEMNYNEFPGTYRYLLIAEPTIVTEGLEHVEVAVFPTNPWKPRGSWLLSIRALSDDRAGIRQEHERIRIGQSGYVIEDQQMRDAEDRLFIRFLLFCDPADPEAEPARIAAHLAARYPGFLSMEPVRD